MQNGTLGSIQYGFSFIPLFLILCSDRFFQSEEAFCLSSVLSVAEKIWVIRCEQANEKQNFMRLTLTLMSSVKNKNKGVSVSKEQSGGHNENSQKSSIIS
eukprot:TRINITY_DN4970_c0_g1_i1.p1 TRINITY_DN4970_c0_g1~~TRINITY_DN4970_c0_g1_i1.p1  ORF type:complete len:100 (-),score=5.62 TRINITY_DN4970_c0_g1_i1:131-430(-)